MISRGSNNCFQNLIAALDCIGTITCLFKNLTFKKAYTGAVCLFSISVIAGEPFCDRSLPIDNSKKAWCAAKEVLNMQSCVSKYGFTYGAIDMDFFWLLIVQDKNPDLKTVCKTTQLEVNKNSGVVSYLKYPYIIKKQNENISHLNCTNALKPYE